MILKLQSQDWDHYLIDKLCCDYFSEFLGQQNESQRTLYRWSMLPGEQAASLRRLNFIERLIRFKIQVRGDPGREQLAAKGLNYRSRAGHYQELTWIYNSTSINPDINRFYQQDIVTMRVFDVLAFGGFIIAEHSDALDELFEIGVELESFRTFDELADKIKYYLTHEEIARKIAVRGFQVIQEKHTVRLRVAEMLEDK